MDFFTTKGKRTAHTPRFDPSELEVIRKKTREGPVSESSGDESETKKNGIIASGEVDTGNILSKKDFERSANGEDDGAEFDNEITKVSVTLRPRSAIPYMYCPNTVWRQCEELGYYENLHQEQQKANRKKCRARAKHLPATPLFSQKPKYCRPMSGRASQWDSYLKDAGNVGHVAPVELFKQAPLASNWKRLAKVGLMIEVRNPFVYPSEDVYSACEIVHFAGYYALVEFNSSSKNGNELSGVSYPAWISFCSDVPKPIGWTAKNGKTLVPVGSDTLSPEENHDYSNCPTISENHVQTIIDQIQGMWPLRPMAVIRVEVQDPDNPDEVHSAQVTATVGNRVHLWYKNGKSRWVNATSDVHPLGWARAIGIQREDLHFPPVDASQLPKFVPNIEIEIGMMLEMRHPRVKHKVVAAVVTEVLNYQYFKVETRERNFATRVASICHITSPFTFPVGWASRSQIYLDSEKVITEEVPRLKLSGLPKRSAHGFKTGMKLEALISLSDGEQYVVAATVLSVLDHLLLIHYDGTEMNEINTKWVDVQFSDIYPAGYSELVGIKFRGCPGVIAKSHETTPELVDGNADAA